LRREAERLNESWDLYRERKEAAHAVLPPRARTRQQQRKRTKSPAGAAAK
jgi:hypothetical protein